MAKITGWSIRDGFRLRRVLRPYLLRVLKRSPDETVEDASAEQYARAIELATLEHPNNWLLFYVLGSKRLEMYQLAPCLAASLRCVELRPKDIRSTFALATAYNLLADARISDAALRRMSAEGQVTMATYMTKRKESALIALSRLNITPSDAAKKAQFWFDRSLELKPDSWSREQIQNHLSTLISLYPELKE